MINIATKLMDYLDDLSQVVDAGKEWVSYINKTYTLCTSEYEEVWMGLMGSVPGHCE